MDPIYYYFVWSPANPGRRQLVARPTDKQGPASSRIESHGGPDRGPGKVKTPELIMAATSQGLWMRIVVGQRCRGQRWDIGNNARKGSIASSQRCRPNAKEEKLLPHNDVVVCFTR